MLLNTNTSMMIDNMLCLMVKWKYHYFIKVSGKNYKKIMVISIFFDKLRRQIEYLLLFVEDVKAQIE
jgi:hypothetical protein